VHYSEEWKQQIGYADGEIEDDFGEWERRVHPEDLPQESARVQRYLTAPLPGRAAESATEYQPEYESEFRFRHQDGTYRHILTHAALEYDQAGEPLHMYGSHIDITQRVQTEEALRHASAKTPVILISGHPMGEDPVELDERRIAAWVEKPPRAELLAQALAAALEG
jgi:PAS domain S-box-containing protein